MRRNRLTLLSLTLAMAVLASLPMSAAAFSNTNSYNVTTNLKLTANVWIGTGCINGFGWQGSSVLSGSDPKKPNWIKVEFNSTVNGLFVSVSGTGGTTTGGGFNFAWTNSNGARSASGSGTLQLSNCITWINVDASTAASVYVYGVSKKILTATSKWW